MQRLPKLHGFRSYRAPAEAVFTGDLDQFGTKTVDTFALAEAGLISNPFIRVKLLVRGEVTKKVTVKIDGASESAIALIQKAGGTFEKVARVKRPASIKKAEKKEKREKERAEA